MLPLVPLLLAVTTILPPPRGVAASYIDEPDLVIIHINDFHGQVLPLRAPSPRGGVLALAREVEAQRARARRLGAKFLFTDGGDWFQGTPEGNTSKGRFVVHLQDEIGVDLAVLGNHEFDFGADNARALVARARHPVLAANVVRIDGVRPPWLRPSWVLTIDGVRIAFVGLVTKKTKLQSTGPFGRLEFQDEVECLRRELPRIRRRSDAIVLLTHCGFLRDRELAKEFPEVRLILGGHSHTSLKTPVRVGETVIVQTGGKSTEYYAIDLKVDAKSRSLRVVRAVNRRIAPQPGDDDSPLARWVDARTQSLHDAWDSPVGELAAPLAGSRGVSPSTSAGNLLADLIRDAGEAQIGIMNRGGIRARLAKGKVTRRQVFELLPFDNDVVSMDLTGDQIRSVLLEGLQTAQRPFEVSGLRYEVVRGEGGGTASIGSIERGDGSPLAAEAVYRVATNSFLSTGGDGAVTFLQGRERRRHPRLLRELLLDALQAGPRLVPPGEARIRVR